VHAEAQDWKAALAAYDEAAAKLLAEAPGLGCSSADHPGHLLFPLFCTLLGGGELVGLDPG
jgi:hypothetical protein